MKRALFFGVAICTLAALGACGERPQVLQSNKSDVPAYQGAPHDPFVAGGWKAGDRTGWEQGLKTRMQNSQNEYNKMSVAK
jgi:hypothetical protein